MGQKSEHRPKRALITGITGQDGSYLAEHLLELGYQVSGMVRRVAMQGQEKRLERIQHLTGKIDLIEGDVCNYGSIVQALQGARFDECYHLAAQSDVGLSFKDPFATFRINIEGTLNVLEAIRHKSGKTKFYFAGSSEMFGKVRQTPQNEKTPFHPRSPYGVSKVAGYDLTRNYRESYGLFACSGILFNHESPRRGENFVTRKITRGVAKIRSGEEKYLFLGNLDAKRDWGHAKDYVRGMHMMLQQDKPDDYVLATGDTHTVEEFAKWAFAYTGRDYKEYVKTDAKLYRPAEVEVLLGDSTKAKMLLGWRPEYGFRDLVEEMVMADVNWNGGG